MPKNRLAEALLAEGDIATYAHHLIDTKPEARPVLRFVFDMLIHDEAVDPAQRGRLKMVFSELFPEEADRFTVEHGVTPEPRWWRQTAETSEPSL